MNEKIIVLLLLMITNMPSHIYGEDRSEDDYPTAFETAMVEHINRFRSDPVAEKQRILDGNAIHPSVDKAMFIKEMDELKPVPPLVINYNLLKTAR